MSEPFLGEIRMVGFNFAPRGWAFCQGQTLAVAQNSALFALLGTTFGGNGQVTFGLPDLQGRSPVGMGNGGGLTPIDWGAKSGTENITLNQNQMPTHSHPAQFTGRSAQVGGSAATTVTVGVGTGSAAAMVPPSGGATSYLTATTAKAGLTAVTFNGLFTNTAPTGTQGALGGITANTLLNDVTSTAAGTVTVSPTGGTQPVPTRNPYLGVAFIIATEGIFPSRP